MGVLPEGGKGVSKEGVDAKIGSRGLGGMRAIEEDLGAEAEVGVAKTTFTSNESEVIKIEVSWKITEFAEKMRVQDTVTFSKVERLPCLSGFFCFVLQGWVSSVMSDV